ncbi:hypothetical protein SAMN05428949_5913 [Chitinophaga sp. YR627]|nr:hypothetical protein SAMN05428949_5913 [Chitinophaga sp. YR627]
MVKMYKLTMLDVQNLLASPIRKNIKSLVATMTAII